MATGKIIKRKCLFGEKTYFITLDAGLDVEPFNPGDSIAIFPKNDLDTISKIMHFLDYENFTIYDKNTFTPLKSFLLDKNINKISPKLLDKIGRKDPKKINVWDFIEDIKSLNLRPDEFLSLLDPIRPRLYSLASSYTQNPRFLDLIVTLNSFEHRGQTLFGLASNFLCKKANHNTPIKFELKKNPNFNLPEDPNKPIIMIGAGAGLAPFRSFMQDRLATKSTGENWLFFGERYNDAILFTEDPWKTLLKQRKLKITTAFSRETAEKVYVQHQIEKESLQIWDFLRKESVIYICGSREMGKEVEKVLLKIFSEFLGDSAPDFLKKLKADKKLCFDIY